MALGTPGKTVATAFEVLCRGWPVAGTVFYDVTFSGTCLLLNALLNCSHVHCLLRALTPVSDPFGSTSSSRVIG